MSKDSDRVTMGGLWFLANALQWMREIGEGGATVDVEDLIPVSTKLALPVFTFLHASMLRAEDGLNSARFGANAFVVRANHKPKYVIHGTRIVMLKGPQEYLMQTVFGQERAA